MPMGIFFYTTAMIRNCWIFLFFFFHLYNGPVAGLVDYQLASLESFYQSLNGDSWSYGFYPDETNEVNVNRTWFNGIQTDPCVPSPWYGLECSDDNTTITGMDLSYYNLEGSLPDDVFLGLNTTQNLTLYQNNIYHQIPSSLLSSKRTLVYLDLGANDFSGRIPNWLWDLYALESLYLNKNNLNGTLSNQLCKLANLSVLWVYSNELTGSIPQCSSMPQITEFQLYKNRLTGIS